VSSAPAIVATPQSPAETYLVTELPKLPAPRPVAENSGRSQVTYQDPAWQPNPIRPNNPPSMLTVDKYWWSGMFQIDAEALAKSFATAFDKNKVEQSGVVRHEELMETALIDVELIRQELSADGTWGTEQIVPPLQNSLRPPFPGKTATEPQIMQYLNEVSAMPQELINPVFYEVVAGDPWLPPGEELDKMRAADRAARKTLRQQQKERQRQMALQHQQQRNELRRPAAGFNTEAPGRMPDALDQNMKATRPRGGGVALAPGRHNDVQMLGDIRIMAHDDTAEPGKTYRYKLRYRLLNPIWRMQRIAPRELVGQFAITSP
jgi:hypothetical protein